MIYFIFCEAIHIYRRNLTHLSRYIFFMDTVINNLILILLTLPFQKMFLWVNSEYSFYPGHSQYATLSFYFEHYKFSLPYGTLICLCSALLQLYFSIETCSRFHFLFLVLLRTAFRWPSPTRPQFEIICSILALYNIHLLKLEVSLFFLVSELFLSEQTVRSISKS